MLLVSPPGQYGKLLEKEGFRWYSIDMDRRSLNPLDELSVIRQLIVLFCSEKPDIVHGFTIKCAVYGALCASLSGVKAIVGAVAGLGYVFTSRDIKARLLRPVVRALLRGVLNGNRTRLILQNPDDLEMFVEARLVEKERIRLIKGSGVDCERFQPLGRTADDELHQPMVVLFAARLLWDKGIKEYVDAARLLRDENREIRFLIAGEPDSGNPAAVGMDALERWVDEGIVEWVGHVDDMPKLFAQVDAMVLPSYREGLPKTLIEAGACGLPLVTTDVPGCREVVTHNGVDGFKVPVRDYRALAAAIRSLDDDSNLRLKLGARARERALEEFDERIVIDKTISVYRELIEL